MSNKGVIIGTFVRKNKILSSLEMMKNDLGINVDKVFIYEIGRNKNEYLVTFKTYDKDKYVKSLSNFAVLHVKNGCLFSINALNKLIDGEKTEKGEKNDEHVIDWSKYSNKLIILTNGELSISELVKIEDKTLFFT